MFSHHLEYTTLLFYLSSEQIMIQSTTQGFSENRLQF